MKIIICSSSLSMYNFTENHDHTVIFANGNSIDFEIPADYKDSSIQLIWFTDEFTQCICPLVEELLDICACNRGNNRLSLSNNIVTISHFKASAYLVVYLVNSTLTSTSCCNLRSIKKIYRVFEGISSHS